MATRTWYVRTYAHTHTHMYQIEWSCVRFPGRRWEGEEGLEHIHHHNQPSVHDGTPKRTKGIVQHSSRKRNGVWHGMGDKKKGGGETSKWERYE